MLTFKLTLGTNTATSTHAKLTLGTIDTNTTGTTNPIPSYPLPGRYAGNDERVLESNIHHVEGYGLSAALDDFWYYPKEYPGRHSADDGYDPDYDGDDYEHDGMDTLNLIFGQLATDHGPGVNFNIYPDSTGQTKLLTLFLRRAILVC